MPPPTATSHPVSRPSPPPGDGDARRERLPNVLLGFVGSSMFRYIVLRVVAAAALLVVVSALTFLIFYALPSADPAALRAGRQATPELIAQIRRTLGLDQPLYVQFWRFLKGVVLHFDLGYSYQNQVSVRSELLARLPVTLSLTAGAFVIWILVAIPVGTISATRSRSLADRTLMGASLVAISAPVYWLGLLALFLFSTGIGVVPLLPGAGSYTPFLQNPWQWFTGLVMPWCVLAAGFAAFYARMVRANVIDVMHEDYIRTARAKGLSQRRVLVRHALRVALTPIVTMAGLDVGVLLGGAILTETVFNIPGIGRFAYDAIANSDLPAIQGTVLFGAFFIVVANIVVDVLYAYLDPRIRY